MPIETRTSKTEPIAWSGAELRMLDQRALPHRVRYIAARDAGMVAEAIRTLAVRGAPLIGVAAAYGLALAARLGTDAMREAASELAATRPTAVNLRWAIERVTSVAGQAPDAATAAAAEAMAIHHAQVAADLAMGRLGAGLLTEGTCVLTHCNTGTLATGGIGTALGVIKTAHRNGMRLSVLVDETRPLLQGSRLTAWELAREGVPHTVIADAAAAGLIARGEVQAILVGADRIAANGDVANKVGTYGLALAARAHGVPFYVVAPTSTIDTSYASGAGIPIEDRGEEEVLAFGGGRPAPSGTRARNPAFDVTAADFVTSIVTEQGLLRPPYVEAIAEYTGREAVAS